MHSRPSWKFICFLVFRVCFLFEIGCTATNSLHNDLVLNRLQDLSAVMTSLSVVGMKIEMNLIILGVLSGKIT